MLNSLAAEPSFPTSGSPMSARDYCSKICGAKCCKAHGELAWPPKCPKLTTDNLCSIYPNRIGFAFDGIATDGARGKCVCSGPSQFLETLSPEILAQCCIAHPELLENSQITE